MEPKGPYFQRVKQYFEETEMDVVNHNMMGDKI